MKLSHFPNCCALNSQVPMTAFLHSCQQHGITLVPNSRDADAAVIWSVTWTGRMQANQEIYQHYTQTGRPVIILEVGALNRGVTWKIAVNNITADGHYGHHDNLDHARPARLKLLQQSMGMPKPTVLIVAQNSHSLQVSNIKSMDQWIADTVHQVQQHTDRPIILRPHPRSRLNLTQLPKQLMIQSPKKLLNTYDSFDIDFQHHAVINYNSGAGTQAAIAGATVITHKSSLAHPVSTELPMIEHPQVQDRHQWLIEISHTEYTTKEIQQGLWIQRLASYLPL